MKLGIWQCAALALAVRLLVLFVVSILEDPSTLTGFKYTDVDYDVFADAALLSYQGRSPFRRHTYRYTPFLASFMALFVNESEPGQNKLGMRGKVVFSVADVMVGLLIYSILCNSKSISSSTPSSSSSSSSSPLKIACVCWLFNPLPINMCTRGSSESLLVLLPVLGTLSACLSSSSPSVFRSSSLRLLAPLVAGCLHGAAVHAKLYPIIYSLSYVVYYSSLSSSSSSPPFPSPPPSPLRSPLRWLFSSLMLPSVFLFIHGFLLSFLSSTYLAYKKYGADYLQEGLLYHFSRADHRHNYSVYWYWIYLSRWQDDRRGYFEHFGIAPPLEEGGGSGSGLDGDENENTYRLSTIGKFLFLPQFLLLLYTSVKVASVDLPFALFLQTFLFVAHNKVITGQYFLWYLVLLPLCYSRLDLRSFHLRAALASVLASLVLWLGNAYRLEMLGHQDAPRAVAAASAVHLAANTYLFVAIVRAHDGGVKKKEE